MTKKKAKSPSKAVSTEVKKKVIFAGAKDLFGEYGSKEAQVKRDSLMVVAQVLEISPFGVNLLGGLPYVNNLGLKQKMNDYYKGANFEYQWIKRAETDDDKALCEARIVHNGKPLKIGGAPMPWILGEASPASMKMGTLRGYQNHIAQTRAENRAIRYAVGVRVHEELLSGVAKLKGLDEKIAAQAVAATSVSAEEMNEATKPAYTKTLARPINGSSTPYELAIDFVNKANSVASLRAAQGRIEAHSEFTDEQKKELKKSIRKRLLKIKPN